MEEIGVNLSALKIHMLKG